MVREPFPLSIDWGTILGLPPALVYGISRPWSLGRPGNT
jgi:hypothetical protein